MEELKIYSMDNTDNSKIKRYSNRCSKSIGFILILLLGFGSALQAQQEASGSGFNYFSRQWFNNNTDGMGYSFYAAAWPIMQQYPGPQDFQLGLPSTWMQPYIDQELPPGYYNTIEGGLGWWHDTRFGTETPKFIMGGVSMGFNSWANGVGAGRSDLLWNGHRNWNQPGGKYGVAQLSQTLLWPPDGLNIEQDANGEFLGYGYHPLPITDPMETTYGIDFATGNQCWTLFLNSTNFKGPTTFVLPTFWTETVLDQPELEGLFLDSRKTDKNQAFAIEYAESPALVAEDKNGDLYAKILPLTFPITEENRSEVIREILVFTEEALWIGAQEWFSGGAVPSTQFQADGVQDVFFNVGSDVDGKIQSNGAISVDAPIDYDPFASRFDSPDERIAGFEFTVDMLTTSETNFILPEYYKLSDNNEWEAIMEADVPAATGLLENEPEISPRPEDLPYLTPKEPDCHLQDPDSPWNSPGPVAGPFQVSLCDGSRLTYYWYRFVDQPAVIQANLPEEMRQNMQERVELIHSNWSDSDEYLPPLSDGELVGLDAGLIVSPPEGFEIGYVPIVTRQELDDATDSVNERDAVLKVVVFPNPASDAVTIRAEKAMERLELVNSQGQIVLSESVNNALTSRLPLQNISNGLYFLHVELANGQSETHKIIKE